MKNKNPTSSQVKNIGNAFEKCEQLQETRLVKYDKDLVGCLRNSLHYMCYLSVREDREVSQVH